MKLSNSKRLAIIQWFNCMCVGHPIKGLKELADGKCFLKLQSKIDPSITAVGEDAKGNYTLIEQFLNEYFETQIKGLINFKNCIRGSELELAKLSILLLSASVKSILSSNGDLDGLLHLNEDLQESIRDCMSAVVLGNANGNILAPDFSNVLSSYSVWADTPRRPSSSISARSSRKSKVQEDSVSSSPSSPLKVFWDSPQIAQQLKVKKMERELAELRQQLHREEDKFIDIEEEKKYHAEKLSEKDKEITELKKMVEQLRGVEDMACDANELKTTCESFRAEIESLKYKLLEADNLKLEVRHLALENEELSNVRNELQSKCEELNKIKNENFNERMNYQELQRSLNDCTERLKALLTENADLRQSVEESQTQYAELKVLNDETLKDIRKLQDSPDLPKGESMDAIINEGNRELEQENSNLKNENISLKGDICCFSRKISELEKSLKEQEVVFSMQEKNLKANCEVIMNKLKNVMDKNKELESDLFATSSSLNSVQVEKQQMCEFMQTREFTLEEVIEKRNEKIVDLKQNIDSLNNDKSAFLLEMHNLMLKNEALENELCANRAELVKKAENVQLLEDQISLQSNTIHQKTEAFLNVQQELNYLMEKSVLSENRLEEKLKCTQSDLGNKYELIDELQREVSRHKNDCANSLMQVESLNVMIREGKEKEAQNHKSYDDEYRRLEMLIQKQSEELISKEETISHNMCVNESILIHNKKLEDENQKLDERVTFLQEGQLEKSDLPLLLEKAEAKINFQACEICNLTKKLQDQEQSLTTLKNSGLEMENLRNTIQALECSNTKAKILSENIQLLTCEKNCLVEENKQLKVQIQSVSDTLNLKDIQEKENLNTFITQIENMKAEFEGRMKLWEQEKIMIKVENELYVSSLNTETEKMKVSHDSKVKSLQEQISNNQLVNDELNLNFINHLETCSMNEKELENLKIAIKKRDSCRQELIDSLRDLDRELNIQKERNEQMEKEYSMCIEQRDSRIETLIKESMHDHKKVIETKDKQIDEYLQKIEALEEAAVRAENQMRGEIRKLQNIMENIQTGLFCSGAECKLQECLTLQDLIATYQKIKSALLVVAEKKESRIHELEERVLVFESKYSTSEGNTVGEIDEMKHILKNVQESNDELNAKNLSCTLKIEENEKELFVLSSKLLELSKENGQLKLDKQHAEDILVTTVDNVKQELDTEKKKMENINKDLNVKNEELNQEASSLIKKLKLLENENEKLKFGHMEKKKIFEEMKQLQMTVIASRARNEEFLGVLNGKNKKLKSDLESTGELLSKTEKEKSEVETQLLSSNQKVLKLQSIVESYKKSHSCKQKQMQAARKQLETAYQRIEKLEARIAQLESINIKYRQQVACFGKQEVKNKTRKRASENKSFPARELASSPDRPYFEMNSHLCTPHKKSVPFSENSDSIVPNLRRNINHTESYITSYTLNSTRNSFQDITDLSVAEMNITPVGGKSFLGNRFLPLDEEEDFLNHSSLADLKPAMPCLPPPTATRRISELQRRNTLCPPHLRTSYPVETQMHSASKYSEDALRAGHAVEDNNCVSFLGEHSKEYKKVSPKRKRSSSDTPPEQIKKVSKKVNVFETIKVSVSSPKPSSLRSRLQRTPSALKQFFNTRRGLENSVEKSKPKKGSRL